MEEKTAEEKMSVKKQRDLVDLWSEKQGKATVKLTIAVWRRDSSFVCCWSEK